MKRTKTKTSRSAIAIAAMTFSTFFGGVVVAQDNSPRTSDDTDGTARTTFDEIEWNVFPGGRAIADVVGNFKTGAHLKFVRFDAGVKTPPHVHSYSYTGIVVTGRARHYEPGNPATQTILEPGSTWTINAGVAHISECLEGSDCLFATQSGGAFDSAPAE
jgi:quercetin dioxygenase-like cupin family protein